MENEALYLRLHVALNKEAIRQMLTKYFQTKGFNESMEKQVYPPQLQDIIIQIPQLMSKIEIAPFVEDIEPNSGVVKLGWNLFVLGTNRMFLGYSTHTNLSEVRTPVLGPMSAIDKHTHATPKRIIDFIVEMLGASKAGDISSIPKTAIKTNVAFAAGDYSGYFKPSNRAVL